MSSEPIGWNEQLDLIRQHRNYHNTSRPKRIHQNLKPLLCSKCFKKPTPISAEFQRFWNWARGVLSVVDFSGVTTNSFVVAVSSIGREDPTAHQIGRLFESLKIDERPNHTKNTLARIFIDLVIQTDGFERDPTDDETTRVLVRYDDDGNTVASEETEDTIEETEEIVEEQTTPVSSPLIIPENTAGPNVLNLNEERPEPESPTLGASRTVYTLGEWDEEEQSGNFGTFTEQITSQPFHSYFSEMSQTQTQQTVTSSIPLESNQQSSSNNQQSSSNNQQSNSNNQQSSSNNQQSSSSNQRTSSTNQPWGRPVSPTGGFGGRPFGWRPELTSTYPWPGATSASRRNVHRGGISWNTSNQAGYSDDEAEEPQRVSRRNTSRRTPTRERNPDG